MENLNKTIKKLNDKDYEALLTAVAGNKKDKPFMVLEAARKEQLTDSEMIERLGVNPSTYYTLKSRLNTKIAGVLSKEVQNPIGVLMEKVARVPANLYGTNKNISIKALENLEKELIEYDLNNELIVVYKTLARLNLYSEHFSEYQRLYDKHVAFSLAVTKAEDTLYDFTKRLSNFLLTRSHESMEEVTMVRREMSNIYELYESHRLFVLNSILRIYYWCKVPGNLDELKARELEVDEILQEIAKIFDKYELDTFYQNIKPLVDFMYFEYYQKTKSVARAEHYFRKVNALVPELCKKHIMSFYIIQFLDSKVDKYLFDRNIDKLIDLNKDLKDHFEVDINETYNYAVLKRFFAIGKFYEGDYAAAAKLMNELRNEISLRNYPAFDMECKLFQALQYCMLGEQDLCLQLLTSINRVIDSDDKDFAPAKLFVKMLKAAMKTTEFRQKVSKVTELYDQFYMAEKGNHSWLWYVRLDDHMIRRLANPLK